MDTKTELYNVNIAKFVNELELLFVENNCKLMLISYFDCDEEMNIKKKLSIENMKERVKQILDDFDEIFIETLHPRGSINIESNGNIIVKTATNSYDNILKVGKKRKDLNTSNS